MIITLILLSLCISGQLNCMDSKEQDVHNQAHLTVTLKDIEQNIGQLAGENNSAEFARLRSELDAQLNSISQHIERSHKWGSIDFNAREKLITKWRKLNSQFCELIQWAQPHSVYGTPQTKPKKERLITPSSSRFKQHVREKSTPKQQKFSRTKLSDTLYKYALRAGIVYVWYAIFWGKSTRKNKSSTEPEQVKA